MAVLMYQVSWYLCGHLRACDTYSKDASYDLADLFRWCGIPYRITKLNFDRQGSVCSTSVVYSSDDYPDDASDLVR